MVAIVGKNDAMVTALLAHNANPDIQDEVPQEMGGVWVYEDNNMSVAGLWGGIAKRGENEVCVCVWGG